MVGAKGWKKGNGKLLSKFFNKHRAPGFHDKKSSGDWSHNDVNILNTTEPYT